MIEPLFIITNNPLSKKTFEPKYRVEYIDGSAMDVLKKVRDNIHLGHKLLTHPLMSSVKPNETPYRTACLSLKKENLDIQSLEIIEKLNNDHRKIFKRFQYSKLE